MLSKSEKYIVTSHRNIIEKIESFLLEEDVEGKFMLIEGVLMDENQNKTKDMFLTLLLL